MPAPWILSDRVGVGSELASFFGPDLSGLLRSMATDKNTAQSDLRKELLLSFCRPVFCVKDVQGVDGCMLALKAVGPPPPLRTPEGVACKLAPRQTLATIMKGVVEAMDVVRRKLHPSRASPQHTVFQAKGPSSFIRIVLFAYPDKKQVVVSLSEAERRPLVLESSEDDNLRLGYFFDENEVVVNSKAAKVLSFLKRAMESGAYLSGLVTFFTQGRPVGRPLQAKLGFRTRMPETGAREIPPAGEVTVFDDNYARRPSGKDTALASSLELANLRKHSIPFEVPARR